MKRIIFIIIIGILLISCGSNTNKYVIKTEEVSSEPNEEPINIPVETVAIRCTYIPKTPLNSELLTKSLDELIIMKYDEKIGKWQRNSKEYYENIAYDGRLKHVADTTKLAKAYCIDMFNAFREDNYMRVSEVIESRDKVLRREAENNAMKTWDDYLK
ncbi:MAG: hypothetical protein IKO34_12605 [Bacteroidales bacterium]|jgi:hypothetical protein|nr:hypothetical protein [Bacteroidales bacterium]